MKYKISQAEEGYGLEDNTLPPNDQIDENTKKYIQKIRKQRQKT